MIIPLLTLALSFSAPAAADTSALDALRGSAELPQVAAPAAAMAQAPAASAPGPDAGAALIAEASRKSVCYDGSDQEIHGAPMCALALSGDPEERHFVISPLPSRGHGNGGYVVVQRETKLFSIGKGSLSGHEHWAVASRRIVLDADGAVVSATETTPAICASEAACPGAAIQPYLIRDASGAEKKVLIGRTDSPLSPANVRAELETTLAAARARTGR